MKSVRDLFFFLFFLADFFEVPLHARCAVHLAKLFKCKFKESTSSYNTLYRKFHLRFFYRKMACLENVAKKQKKQKKKNTQKNQTEKQNKTKQKKPTKPTKIDKRQIN